MILALPVKDFHGGLSVPPIPPRIAMGIGGEGSISTLKMAEDYESDDPC